MDDFDPRRSDTYARPLSARMIAGRGTAEGRRTLSADDLRRWTPVVRRHAMRIADKCAHAIGVAELTEVGMTGLLEAVVVAGPFAPETEAERTLEMAVLGAMRSHMLARRAAADAARRQSAVVARAIGGLGPPRVALRAARAAIVDRLGWTLHVYERTLLSIAQAGLARVEMADPLERGPTAPDGDGDAMPFGEALAALSHDDRALVALLYVDDLDLPTAAIRLGRSPREVTVDHVEIVHRLRVAVTRA